MSNDPLVNPFTNSAAPRPWRIDKDNSQGIEIVADDGNLVYVEDYGSIPDERGSGFRETMVAEIRANAYLIVQAVNAFEARYAKHRFPVLNSEPKPSHNQHPKYEQWKSICPKCASTHTRHHGGSREYEVTLKCSDCREVFTLKEGFEAELARQGGL